MAANGCKNTGLTVIFKGTTACNAGCRFCSSADNKGETIGDADFDLVVQRIEEYIAEAGITRLNFTFHGGEPTLLGAKFLERACSRLRELPAEVEFSMQSNLLSFPDKQMEIVRRYGIRVGSSVDPIESGRCLANGKDCFPTWLKTRQKLSGADIHGGSIFLVTRPSLGQGKRVHDILNACNAMSGSRSSFQFNLVYRQGRAAENEDLLVSAEEGAQFLVEAYEAWEASGRESQVTPFADLVDWFDSDRENPPRLTCWFMGRCNETHIGIDSDLNIAGCGRRLDFANFYGNLRNQSIASVLEASQERKKIGVRSELLAKGECAGCKFFPICHGGCPDDAALDTGDVAGRSPDCAAFKKLFEVMAARADAGVKHLDPPVLQQTPRTMVHLATDAGIVSDITRPYERLECWILPTVDGRTLKFNARLHDVLGRGADKVRLYVPSVQMRSLPLWGKVVCDARVEVVLFDEPESLVGRLTELARLGARARLDLSALFNAGWSQEAALELVERYLRELDWKVRIEPFESMLMAAVHRQRVPLLNHYGLEQGHFRICIGSLAGVSEAARTLLGELRELDETDAAAHFAARRACLDCKSFVVCASQLTPFYAGGCGEPLHALVERLQASATEIRAALAEKEEAAEDAAPVVEIC